MKIQILVIYFLLAGQLVFAQTNIRLTNPIAKDLLKGNYDAATYADENALSMPEAIFEDLVSEISPDTLKVYVEKLTTFGNRNTGSDTLSESFGIGAARTWVHQKFQQLSVANGSRLVPTYLQFDQGICNMNRHKNVLAILPGVGDLKEEVVIVEAHIDSRCEGNCDVDCIAEGADDNGSGTALIIELARVMSNYAFERTVVFMATTAEEQGLFGANAFATYCEQNDVQVVAVYNNDIVAGTICGTTASPPGCPGLNAIDSINVRVYSNGGSFSKHKGLARYTKLQYEQNIADRVGVQTVINIMSPEDRSGRGGDHIPFRQRGYPAIRFTSANEHGNGNPSTPDYSDRQHTTEDILGEDTDGDGVIDSFYVDFNYLARNTLVNGNAIASAAFSPAPPIDFSIEEGINSIRFEIQDDREGMQYFIGLREQRQGNEFLLTKETSSKIDSIGDLTAGIWYVTVAAIDSNGIESLFLVEERLFVTTNTEDLQLPIEPIELLQNYPNPFDEATTFAVVIREFVPQGEAFIVVHDLRGKILAKLPLDLKVGVNELQYDYQYHSYQPGTYAYSLEIDGKILATKRMIYAY